MGAALMALLPQGFPGLLVMCHYEASPTTSSSNKGASNVRAAARTRKFATRKHRAPIFHRPTRFDIATTVRSCVTLWGGRAIGRLVRHLLFQPLELKFEIMDARS